MRAGTRPSEAGDPGQWDPRPGQVGPGPGPEGPGPGPVGRGTRASGPGSWASTYGIAYEPTVRYCVQEVPPRKKGSISIHPKKGQK